LRAQGEEREEPTTFVTKGAVVANTGYFPKAAFEINMEAGTVICPEGQVAEFRFRPGHQTDAVFAASTCAICPLAMHCVRKPGTGRTV
jgi:hypothetical protein